MTFVGNVTGITSVLASFNAFQQIYEQNKNLDNVRYQINGGATWRPSELISAEILGGYQYLKFTSASVDQPPPFLSQFNRSKDSFQNFFFMGNLNWQPTSLLRTSLQSYRTIQQTAVQNSLFATVTGVNLAASHTLTNSTTLTLNLGLEEDHFENATGTTGRNDFLKNVAVGLRYRAVEWVGVGFQYMYEDRSSTQDKFIYHANTFMVSAQTMF
jgi:hypothetical protein